MPTYSSCDKLATFCGRQPHGLIYGQLPAPPNQIPIVVSASWTAFASFINRPNYFSSFTHFIVFMLFVSSASCCHGSRQGHTLFRLHFALLSSVATSNNHARFALFLIYFLISCTQISLCLPFFHLSGYRLGVNAATKSCSLTQPLYSPTVSSSVLTLSRINGVSNPSALLLMEHTDTYQ